MKAEIHTEPYPLLLNVVDTKVRHAVEKFNQNDLLPCPCGSRAVELSRNVDGHVYVDCQSCGMGMEEPYDDRCGPSIADAEDRLTHRWNQVYHRCHPELEFNNHYPDENWEPVPPDDVCDNCGRCIDTEICHCGTPIEDHHPGSGHNPVCMGCGCGYHLQPFEFGQLERLCSMYHDMREVAHLTIDIGPSAVKIWTGIGEAYPGTTSFQATKGRTIAGATLQMLRLFKKQGIGEPNTPTYKYVNKIGE